jgi:ADP-ribose pyrophosphatase YjhB (NUDIX family)
VVDESDNKPPKNTTAVGGVVVSEQGILLVRMCYGPTKGRFMLPGGIVDPGETLDCAVVREVEEEAGVLAHPLGICGLRTRCDDRNNDTYVIFLLDAISGEPRSDGHENDEARYFSLDELNREDVTDLSAYFGRLALTRSLTLLQSAVDFDAAARGRNPDTWKLFR